MFVLPKGKYKNQEMKDYEETRWIDTKCQEKVPWGKSIMYGISSDYAAMANEWQETYMHLQEKNVKKSLPYW